MAKANLKRDWQPDKAAFDRLLAWLDEGTGSRGERYLEMRQRLVDYFGRRDCPVPEDLADETLNRVARRLEETGSIDDVVPARYCYILAKFVFLEWLRRPGRIEPVAQSAEAVVAPGVSERAENERTFSCLEQCLQSCSVGDRALIRTITRRRVAVHGRIAGSLRRGWGSLRILWPFAPAAFEAGWRHASVAAPPRRHMARVPSHLIRRQ